MPLTAAAAGAGTSVAENPAEKPSPTDEPAIQATPLAPVDSDWIGTLDDAAHPLPQTMWQGTPRALVAAALPRLAPTTSPTLRDLARRLLLSNAEAPQGPMVPDHPSLAALRVERLMALGEVDGALALLDALPSSLRNDELDRKRIELYFAKNDVQGACREVGDGIERHQGVWWERALIACQALAGDQAKASLGLGLLHEQQAPADAVFDALIRAVGGRAAKVDKLPEPRPMLVTLLAAAKLTLPADAVAAGDLPSLRAWADNAAVPPLQRLAAAERAASFGAIPPAALAELYSKVEVKPEELGAAIKHGKPPATPRERAVLFQVARTDPAIPVRAAAIGTLLAEAKKRGDFITMARVAAPLISELSPSQELAKFAPDAVRALYAAGRPELAESWLTFAEPTVPALPLLALLGGTSADAAPGRAEQSVEQLKKLDDARAGLMLALLTSAGLVSLDCPACTLAAQGHDPGQPDVLLWLPQTIETKRVGETVLTTLLLAQSGGRLTADPIALRQAVAGLRAVGLQTEARALALEAALAAGI